MAKSQPSVEELLNQLAEACESMKKAAIAEVREGLGRELADMTTGIAKADAVLRECLRESDIEADVITDDFRAGLAFAAELVADPRFEY